MDKKELKRLIRAEFDSSLKELGYLKKGETAYIKLFENIIRNITFELGSTGFTCWVAMQPLYVKEYTPSVYLHLSFGKRLSRFRVVKREWWPYDDATRGILEIKELLEKNGLPWFDQYGTPEGIVKFISHGKVDQYGIWLDRFDQQQYLGFSLLYLGRTNYGVRVLKRMLKGIGKDSADFIKDYRTQINQLIERIEEHPEDVKKILDDIVQENRAALKI